jgi:hypothetical protein
MSNTATTVIEVRQEHNVSGLRVDQVDGYFADLDNRILAIDPSFKKYGNPIRYWVKTVTERDRCPWGYTWFVEGPDGTLQQWRANWDSSG